MSEKIKYSIKICKTCYRPIEEEHNICPNCGYTLIDKFESEKPPYSIKQWEFFTEYSKIYGYVLFPWQFDENGNVIN